jgi:hypothetical protein
MSRPSFAPAAKGRIGNCNTLFLCASYIAEPATSQLISDIPTWMISAEQLERFEQSVRKLSQRLINPSPHGVGESVRSPVVDPAEVERFERAALI